MQLLTDDIFSLRISTNEFTGRDRLEAFRENFGKAILRVEMEPASHEAFHADMMLHALPAFGMATGSISPVCNHHTPALIDNDDVVIVFLERGNATFEREGHTTDVREGEAVVTENGAVARFCGHTTTHLTNLRFSREKLVPLLGGRFPDAVRQPKLAGSEALALLKHYATLVHDGLQATSTQTRQFVVDHLYELAAHAIGAGYSTRTAAERHGLRAARLYAIKTAILKNLGNRALSAASVAEQQGITSRYVQLLFESEGTTFSEFLLAQRLKRAHRLLSDPAFGKQSISEIAFEVGFNDLSYFNRTFRRAYGATPSDVRQAAKKSD